MLTSLGSIINMIEEIHMSTLIFIRVIIRIFYMSFDNYEASGSPNLLTLMACSYPMTCGCVEKKYLNNNRLPRVIQPLLGVLNVINRDGPSLAILLLYVT